MDGTLNVMSDDPILFLPSCYVLPNLTKYKSIKKLRVTSGMCLFTSNIIAQSSAAVMINLQAILR